MPKLRRRLSSNISTNPIIRYIIGTIRAFKQSMGGTGSVLALEKSGDLMYKVEQIVKKLASQGNVKQGTRNGIDDQLEKSRVDDKYKHKILLLGAGECGKSTVLKQIKALNKIQPTQDELDQYTMNIRRNCIEAIQTLLLVAGELGDELDNIELMEYVEEVLTLELADAIKALTPDLGKTISTLWKDKGIQEVYEKREFFHLMDSTDYYLNEVERIAESDYVPTEEDMIMTRVRTTGMVTSDIREGVFTYQIVDVGGQRSERRKWIHYFDDVRAIVFLEGLSGYNQVLFEDTSSNRMKESMSLFEDILKMNVFKETPIFVFLNKKDLFETMIVKHPLNKCFPDYDGPEGEQRPALDHIEAKYRDIYTKHRGENDNNLFIQVIAARVRMDMKVAFTEVKDTLKRLFPVTK